MSYTIVNVYDAGPALSGATLNAQLYSSVNVAVGSAITTGFYERPGGLGLFPFVLIIPDGHVGWCDIYVNGASGTILATLPINPAELENSDLKTSTRSSHAAADIWAVGTRTLTGFGTLVADIWTSATRTITGGTATTVTGNVGGSVASVSGNVGGNVAGSVASVTAGVTVSTNNDKTGYGLSSAAIQAIWDALTSSLTTVGSIGKRIVDNLDAAISTRMATFTYTTPPTVVAVRTEMDSNSTKLANLDTTVSSRLATAGYTAPDNATIATRASQASVDTANTKLGTPAGASVSADIAAIKAETATILTAILALPNAAAVVTAIFAHVVESGKTFEQATIDIWAVTVGNALADDADTPTLITYASPDATTQVTHALTETTRMHS